jgi:diacylglycerol kinase family enzyme
VGAEWSNQHAGSPAESLAPWVGAQAGWVALEWGATSLGLPHPQAWFVNRGCPKRVGHWKESLDDTDIGQSRARTRLMYANWACCHPRAALQPPMSVCPDLDATAPLLFVVNAAAGSSDAEAKRSVIEAALQAGGRRGDLLFCSPQELARVSRDAAAQALTARTAVVAVGGDGTINTVAQAVHAAGCAMGVVPQGTFNYFARTHGIPADPTEAVHMLMGASALPVQVAGINDRVFLVNASLGLYPDLLEDREAYKARFGRSRWVALWAGGVTLLRAQRQLRLRISDVAEDGHGDGPSTRNVRTLTLFVGNNRLQLAQLGIEPEPEPAPAPQAGPSGGRVTAVMLRPVGTMAMVRLMLHGAMGTLGDAPSVEHFAFSHLVVQPTLTQRRSGLKVAFDGEVTRMRAPLTFRVLDKPLYLLMPNPDDAAKGVVAVDAPGLT